MGAAFLFTYPPKKKRHLSASLLYWCKQQKSFHFSPLTFDRLHVEQEVHDVAILHYVFFTLAA